MSSRSPSHSGTLKAAGAMGFATLLSRVLGLVREQVFAFYFGAGNLTDAFQVAFRIPNLLRDLFAEGAMSASLIPTFTQTRIEEGDARAWRLAGLVFRTLFVVVGILAVLGMVFAPQLAELYASAFHRVPGKFELTVRMTRVMFPFFPLVALAAAFMGILNACGVFFLPAFASALFNLASIVTGVVAAELVSRFLGGSGYFPIEGMAVGVLVGGAVQAFCQLPKLYQRGYRWHGRGGSDPVWHQDPRLKQILWMMLPGTIGLAATQVNVLVNTILATSQGTGSVSWLNYAFRLMQFPIGIFGVSLASATVPKLAEQWTRKDIHGVSDTLSHSLRTVFAINLPASAGLAFLGVPIIELIFEYGRFYSEDTRSTASALAMYAVGLTAYSAVKVLVPACYAFRQTRLPVLSSILTVGVSLFFNLVLVRQFSFSGLALGTSLGAFFNAVFLFGVVRKLIRQQGGEFDLLPILRAFLAYLLVSCLMGVLCFYSHVQLQLWFTSAYATLGLGRWSLVIMRSVKVSLLVLEGVVFYLGISRLFGLREVSEILEIFFRKLKFKLRAKST